jgi:DNA-binding transcriptional regulator YiaG
MAEMPLPSSALNASEKSFTSVSVGLLLAKRLRGWREQHDIPIKRAAAELGVSSATWDHWEKTRRFPSMDDLDLLAQYLRLPPCMLFCPHLHCQCGYRRDENSSGKRKI